MIDNKKALNNESNNPNGYIIPENPSKINVLENMPELVRDVVTLLQSHLIDLDFRNCLNITIAMFCATISAKRICIKKHADSIMSITLSWFAIVLSGSGTGKDYCVKILKTLFFKNFYEDWFSNKVSNYINNEEIKIKQEASTLFPEGAEVKKNAYIKSELAKLRKPKSEIIHGTQEGLFAEASVLNTAGFGSINIRQSEYGRYLKTPTTEKELFDNCLFGLYDGELENKSIKGDIGSENIKNMPCNALLYSDPTVFFGGVRSQFLDRLEAGFARRAVVTFQTKRPLKIVKNDTAENEATFERKSLKLGVKLYENFTLVSEKAQFILSDSSNKILVDYTNYLRQNSYTLDSLLEKEMLSREYKALKLSCVYATFNHPRENIINEVDIQQAITTIEFLSQDFKEFYNYKPLKKDEYDKMYLFFKEHLNVPFSITSLKTEHYKRFGFSRREFSNNFEYAIETLQQSALNDGCILIEQEQNNATTYCLKLKPDKRTNAKPLDEIICGKSGNSVISL